MIEAAWVQFHKSHNGKKIKGVAACKAGSAFLANAAPVCFTQSRKDFQEGGLLICRRPSDMNEIPNAIKMMLILLGIAISSKH